MDVQRDLSEYGLEISTEPKLRKAKLFETAEEAITFAVHSSACEGQTTPPEDINAAI